MIKHKMYYDNQREWKKVSGYVTTATVIRNPFTLCYVGTNDWNETHNYDNWNISFTGATGVNNTPIIKTIYDPSVTSFCMPRTGAFTGLTTTGGHSTNSNEFCVNSSFNKGWIFFTGVKNNTIFVEALGNRNTWSFKGDLYGVGTQGSYWVAGSNDQRYARRLVILSNKVDPAEYADDRSAADIVWPVKE